MQKKGIKNTKKLVFSALMVAMCIIIGWVCKAYLTFGAVRVTFENLPLILSGILLGPIAGACVGAAADIISALLSGFAINPIITVGAASVGFCAGVLARYIIKRKGFFATAAIVLASHLVGSVIIKSIGLYTLGYAVPILLTRIPLYFVIGVVESYLITAVLKNRVLANAFDKKEK